MQAFFPRVDLAEYREQQRAIAAQLAEHPPPRAVSPPPKRAVGRPKLKRSVEAVLAAASAAADLDLHVPDSKRGKYTRWFSSPYINDIIAAFTRNSGSARATVADLQKHAPDDRFARLSHSTVATWFDEQDRLHPSYQVQLDAGRANATFAGRCPVMHQAPEAEVEICDILQKLRKAGTPLNSHSIRWVMLAVLQEKHPALLNELRLTQQYISAWVRHNPRLHFRWRARTTAASKLPDDWEDQGIVMAQRMAATMQLHKVRYSQTRRFQVSQNPLLICLLLIDKILLLADSSLARHQHGPNGSAVSVCVIVDIRDARQRRCCGCRR